MHQNKKQRKDILKKSPREFDDLSVSLCLFCFGKKCRFENY